MKKYHLYILNGSQGFKEVVKATGFDIENYHSPVYIFNDGVKPIAYYPVNRTIIEKIEE